MGRVLIGLIDDVVTWQATTSLPFDRLCGVDRLPSAKPDVTGIARHHGYAPESQSPHFHSNLIPLKARSSVCIVLYRLTRSKHSFIHCIVSVPHTEDNIHRAGSQSPNPFRHSFVSFRSASVIREFVSYSFLTTHIDVVSRHRTSSIHGFLIKHVCFKAQ